MKSKLLIPSAACIGTDMANTVNYAITSLTWPDQAKYTKYISISWSRIFFYNPSDFAAGDGFGEICHMSEYSMVVDLITQEEMITG